MSWQQFDGKSHTRRSRIKARRAKRNRRRFYRLGDYKANGEERARRGRKDRAR